MTQQTSDVVGTLKVQGPLHHGWTALRLTQFLYLSGTAMLIGTAILRFLRGVHSNSATQLKLYGAVGRNLAKALHGTGPTFLHGPRAGSERSGSACYLQASILQQSCSKNCHTRDDNRPIWAVVQVGCFWNTKGTEVLGQVLNFSPCFSDSVTPTQIRSLTVLCVVVANTTMPEKTFQKTGVNDGSKSFCRSDNSTDSNK